MLSLRDQYLLALRSERQSISKKTLEKWRFNNPLLGLMILRQCALDHVKGVVVGRDEANNKYY
jgi:hypothetical protein